MATLYVRLDSTGKAIYFLHNGETTNGYLEIGIVTGLNETSYPGGTYYPLYKNDNLVGTVSGYNKTDTTGATFTFGVSGFDIYARFNGVEFVRFKEYRQMNSGAIAIKANTGYGFRTITMSPLDPISVQRLREQQARSARLECTQYPDQRHYYRRIKLAPHCSLAEFSGRRLGDCRDWGRGRRRSAGHDSASVVNGQHCITPMPPQ